MLLLVFSLIIVADAVIVDKACTTGGKFNERATMCSNLYPDTACQAIYGNLPIIGGDMDRSAACYTTGNSIIDHELKSLASEICPRQCGYCCQSPAYNCANVPRPRISCEIVTQRMCRNPIWKNILEEDCPNMCGFCQKGCVDIVPDCAIDRTICRRMGMEDFVAINCRRTCGFCVGGVPLPGQSALVTSVVSKINKTAEGKCLFYKPDVNPRCVSWITNGFCKSRYFTEEFKKSQCATTCKIC